MLFPSPATDRLLHNLDNGLPSLCAYVFSHPNMVEVAGVAGMDAFMADMMFTAHDWTHCPPHPGGPRHRHISADKSAGVSMGDGNRPTHCLDAAAPCRWERRR